MVNVKESGPIPFDYTFGPIRMQFHTFLQNVDGWGPDGVEIEYDPAEVVLPADIAAYKGKIIAEKEADAKAKGKVFFDGQQVRMKDYGHRVANKETEELKLYLKFGPGSYFTHACTGQIVDKKMLKDENGKDVSIREKYIKDHYSWDDCLGNSVGVSTAIISRPDHALVYVKRSDKITQYPGRFGVAAAGFMDRKKDLMDNVPNPFKTMQRETTEEMGVETQFGDFKITGIGRPWDDLHGELWGVTKTDKTVAQIRGSPKKQKYESLAMLDVPFEPRSVLPILKDAGNTWVNAHAVATIDALLQEYKTDEVLAIAEQLKAEGLL